MAGGTIQAADAMGVVCKLDLSLGVTRCAESRFISGAEALIVALVAVKALHTIRRVGTALPFREGSLMA